MTVFPTPLVSSVASSSRGEGGPEICAVGRLGSFKGVAINFTVPL